MIGSDIAKRYAKAFFDIAAEEQNYEGYYGELKSFSSLIDENRDLREFLANPVFDQSEKKSVVEEILTRIRMSGMTANFLRLLVDKKRIGIAGEIAESYRQLMDNKLRKVHAFCKDSVVLFAVGKGYRRLSHLKSRNGSVHSAGYCPSTVAKYKSGLVG